MFGCSAITNAVSELELRARLERISTRQLLRVQPLARYRIITDVLAYQVRSIRGSRALIGQFIPRR